MNSINKAIKICGGPQALANKAGVSIQRVNNWRTRGQVAVRQIRAVARATDWELTPHQIDPAIYPHPDDGMPKGLTNREESRNGLN